MQYLYRNHLRTRSHHRCVPKLSSSWVRLQKFLAATEERLEEAEEAGEQQREMSGLQEELAELASPENLESVHLKPSKSFDTLRVFGETWQRLWLGRLSSRHQTRILAMESG